MHYVVHTVKRLESIKITFPIRGYSYLECGKNMGLVNLKTRMKVPNDWYELLRNFRKNPNPFIAIEMKQSIVRDWTKFFKTKFVSKCPFPIQSIREIICQKDHSRLLSYRFSYSGT
ncbi:unnamed protein product [Psylliodes chrysocephalus]|uniref:Uncharacterized protein n=1 Tax=Psylliodes chrysocephalus TaxID=3402493 RepID=A0A9P0GGW5_9CUCU|nr:unnamed protein product [Psylliodes chrysocephala]